MTSMTQPFHISDRVTASVAFPGVPFGMPGTIIAIIPGTLAWCLVQPDDQAILPFIISAALLVRVPLVA